jgi:hypothetical protein
MQTYALHSVQAVTVRDINYGFEPNVRSTWLLRKEAQLPGIYSIIQPLFLHRIRTLHNHAAALESSE